MQVTEPRYDTVSFLTDYGTADEFVGVVKAVIRDLAPHSTVLDLTHEIAPFDIRAGALALARCIGYVPGGVVLAVVDPGVATDRRAVAIEVAGGAGVIVGPDNGLLAPAVAMAGGADRAVELTNPEYQLDAAGAAFHRHSNNWADGECRYRARKMGCESRGCDKHDASPLFRINHVILGFSRRSMGGFDVHFVGNIERIQNARGRLHRR